MKTPGVEFIRNSNDFRLVKELKFSDILSFVLENISRINGFTLFYLVINILFFSFLAGQIVSGILDNGFTCKTFKIFSSGLFWGTMTGGFFIIPIHEGFHALAFLLIGAKKIRFGADLKQLIFYATAENFVGGRKGFTFVALAPFIFINLFSLPFMLIIDSQVWIFINVMLLLHNVMCIGDFAMMSFFSQHKDKELYTFDDLETKTAFFYEKIKGR